MEYQILYVSGTTVTGFQRYCAQYNMGVEVVTLGKNVLGTPIQGRVWVHPDFRARHFFSWVPHFRIS